MNIYKCLNEITAFIDSHLEEKIQYEDLAKILGVNVYTLQRIFTMIAGISLSEYIRKRRLSNAGFDLCISHDKVIDLAIKYQYNNATSFSRAFEKFHGIKPSAVNKRTKLKNFPRILFDENIKITEDLDYEIIHLDKMKLYGVGIQTDNHSIPKTAPLFFDKMEDKYKAVCGEIEYGMITYNEGHEECQKYYCLYTKNHSDFETISFPASKWLRFRIPSQNAKEIQEVSQKFYREFLPSCKYNLKELPELEYYHDEITDFLVAIY